MNTFGNKICTRAKLSRYNSAAKYYFQHLFSISLNRTATKKPRRLYSCSLDYSRPLTVLVIFVFHPFFMNANIQKISKITTLVTSNFLHLSVWLGLAWLVWFGLVWFGLVWFGLVWFGWFGFRRCRRYNKNKERK